MRDFKIYLSIITLVFFASCNEEKETTVNRIPADATMVMVANTKQLMSKMAQSGAGLADSTPFTQIFEDTSFKALKSFWRFQDSLSIDFDQPIVSAILPLQQSEEKVPYWATVIPIKNRDSFVGAMKRNFKTDFQMQNGNMYWPIGTEGVLGVGEHYAVAVLNTKTKFVTLPQTRSMFDFTISSDNFMDQIDLIIANKKSKSIAKNRHFKQHELGTNDLKFWMNTEYWILNNTVNNKVLLNLRLFGIEIFKESSVTMLLNSSTGAMQTKMYLHVKDDVTKMLTKTKPKDVDPALLAYLNGNKLYGAFGFAVEPEMIKDYAAHLGQSDIMQWALKQANIKDSDVYQGLSGDAMHCMYGDSTSSENYFNMATLIKLKDSSKIAKLLQLPQLKSSFKALGNSMFEVSTEGEIAPAYWGYNNKLLVRAESEKALQDILTSTGTGTLANQATQLGKGSPFTGFFNGVSASKELKTTSSFEEFLEANLRIVFEILGNTTTSDIKFAHIKDGVIEADINMTFTKKNVNSLAYMLKTTAYKKKKSREEDLSSRIKSEGPIDVAF